MTGLRDVLIQYTHGLDLVLTLPMRKCTLNAFLLFDVDANAPPSVCVRRSASSPRHDPPAATMGKAAGHKEKKDAKRAIKDKKKFKNRNSIGKTRKKGSKYMTRTQAVAKLQVPLKDFRKLCILKGVYPREPKKKAKGGNTTYFFAKDILFLQHEPILAAFREQKAFLKKIRRAAGRHERVQAERLDGRRPTYKLDHLIRERYPTFEDALHELDDVLCLTFLFASLSPSKFVPAARVAACARLRKEFLAYVTRTGALRYTFISIKGIYYQAEVQGVSLTWIEPHHNFSQQPTMVVDYRVMLSFLELYEAVLTFVNYKLYHDLGLVYPPPIDNEADAAGLHLSTVLMEKAAPKPKALAALGASTALGGGSSGAASSSSLSAEELAKLQGKVSTLDRDATALAVADEMDATDEADALEQASDPEAAALRSLFSKCYIYCRREAPIPALEFLILSCGGRVGWEGEASPFAADDERVTHLITDRPYSGGSDAATITTVQPQWVFDCVNARALLPAHGYRPGVVCPPHLSPFLDGKDGYVPSERLRRAATEEEAGEVDEDEEDEDEVELDENGEEMHAEAAPPPKKKGAAAGKPRDEEKELAMLTMSHKKRRLYDRMQFGINRKEKAAQALSEKRKALDAK